MPLPHHTNIGYQGSQGYMPQGSQGYGSQGPIGVVGHQGPVGLPGYSPLNPIFSHFFEVTILTDRSFINCDTGVYIDGISYESKLGEDTVKMSMTFNELGFKSFDVKNYLKDTTHLLHKISDGRVGLPLGINIQAFLVEVEFLEIKTEWSYNLNGMLSSTVIFKNLSSEPVDPNIDHISILRNSKIDKII